MILLLLLTAAFTAAYIYHLKLKRVHKRLENIPGPPLLPFIGNALEFGTSNRVALLNMKRIANQYGPVVRLCIGSQVYILLSEPEYIGQVMSLSESVDKPDFYKLFGAVAGEGLVFASGEKWRRHRRIIEPMFSSKQMDKYMKTFNNNINNLVYRLRPKANFYEADITDDIYKCTMKTIMNTAIDMESEGSEEYQRILNCALDLTLKKFFSLFQNFDFIYKLTGDFKRLQKCKQRIQEYIKSIIAKRKRDLSEGDKDTAPVFFMDKLLLLSKNDVLTDEEIIDEVKTIIAAGSDTVGSAMSFGFFELAKHPDVQRKILDESNLVLGKDKLADVSFEDAQYLLYAECVYKEILRLYPPAAMMIRKLHREIKFDNMVIPAETQVVISVAQTHMSEKDFPDPEKFDPDRHLPENAAKRHPYAFIPFGAGPRMCVGLKYSILEAKVMLVKIIRNFELFSLEPKHESFIFMGATLKSANGLPIRLKPRQSL